MATIRLLNTYKFESIWNYIISHAFLEQKFYPLSNENIQNSLWFGCKSKKKK